MPHRPALAHHSSRVTHHFFIAGPSPSAALRRIDIFFDERPAHSKEYRTTISFSVSDFAQPMSNVLDATHIYLLLIREPLHTMGLADDQLKTSGL